MGNSKPSPTFQGTYWHPVQVEVCVAIFVLLLLLMPQNA